MYLICEILRVYLLIVSIWSLTEVPPMHRAERRGGKPARWWETQRFNRYLFLPFQIWLIWKTAFNIPSCRVAHCNLSGNPRWKVLSRTTWHISCHWARLILIFLLCYISFYRKKVPRFSFFFLFRCFRDFSKIRESLCWILWWSNREEYFRTRRTKAKMGCNYQWRHFLAIRTNKIQLCMHIDYKATVDNAKTKMGPSTCQMIHYPNVLWISVW